MIEYPFEDLPPGWQTCSYRHPFGVANFARMVAAAERGEAFTITRDGAPMAVVIGAAEYDSLLAALEDAR